MSRGRPKPKLRDLSRSPPHPDHMMEIIDAFIQQMASGSPITVAILGASLVELELERMIREKFRRQDNEVWATLTSDGSPLDTFSKKISMGYAFGLYDDVLKDALDTIRAIRNAFAHSKRLINFDHELILQELGRLVLPPNKRSLLYKRLKPIKIGSHNGQLRYSMLCIVVGIRLGRIGLRASGGRIGGLVTQARKRGLKIPEGGTKGLRGLLGLDQTADPKTKEPESVPHIPNQTSTKKPHNGGS